MNCILHGPQGYKMQPLVKTEVYHIATLLIVLYWARAKRSRSGKESLGFCIPSCGFVTTGLSMDMSPLVATGTTQELHWAELLCLRIALLTVCSAQVSSATCQAFRDVSRDVALSIFES